MSACHGRCTNSSVTTSAPRHSSAAGGGIKNGELLKLAEVEFDVFITSDQNIRYQQNLAGFRIAILELSTNDLHRIKAAESVIRSAISAIQPAQLQHLEIP